MGERCDWNPKRHDVAYEPAREGDCPNEATVIVGGNGRWHLCDSCAALPEFSRFKARTRIESSATEDAGGDRK